MAKRSIRDLDLAGKRVFIRVDFNVPLKNGIIGDDTRITASLPTITYALEHGARVVILASHLGRPKGKPNREMSLGPVAARVGELLKRPVIFADDCVGPPAEQAVAGAPDGSVVLLENLRFHPEEEKDDETFAQQLATLGDVYVNDAFGAALAVGEVLPALKGKLDGFSMRVPTPNVSVVDLSAVVEKATTGEEVNAALRAAAEGPLKGILAMSDEPLVSIDFRGNSNSSIIDSAYTKVMDGDLVKVVAWYDNEWGYSNRCVDLLRKLVAVGL